MEKALENVQASKVEQSRTAILEAAYTLFLEQGYAATSMRQIAARAGLALGGIYNHFDGKESIFRELILERHPYHQILPILLSSQSADAETFLRSAATMMVAELGRRPDFIKLMMIELVEFNGRNMPAIMEHVSPQVMPLMQRLRKAKRGLRKIPPFTVFRAFLGLFFSYYLTDLMLSRTSLIAPQDRSLDHFIDIFLHGVLADKEHA